MAESPLNHQRPRAQIHPNILPGPMQMGWNLEGGIKRQDAKLAKKNF